MSANSYQFLTTWRIPGTVTEVADVITDTNTLAEWWPAVYLDVQELEAGDEDGVGKVIDLYTKGWLPYTLRWRFRVGEVERYKRILLYSEGDFVGRGIWTFAQDGDEVVVQYDWQVSAQKPILKALSFLLKPVFSANHHWAMQKGEESLLLELRRRRAATAAERAAVPPPPGPTTTRSFLLAISGVTLVLAAIGFIWRRGRD